MKLTELQQVLGDRVRITGNQEKTEEQRRQDNSDSEVIAKIAKQMINNADIMLRAEKLNTETNISKTLKHIIGNENT